MKVAQKLSLALVKPPLAGHYNRGTGMYFQMLLKSQQKHPQINVKVINVGDPQGGFDLIHYPYFDPFFLTLPANFSKPTLVTVHDLIPLKYKDKFNIGLRGLFKWFIQRNSLQRVSGIITDSFASQKDIIKIVAVKEEKVPVVYLGVAEIFKKINDHSRLNETSQKYNLPAKFLLHVGDVNYNKNIPTLLKAFAQILKLYPDLYLILLGRGFVDDSPNLREVLLMIKDLQLDRKIHRHAQVNQEDLVVLYNLAQVYLQPSLDEGFGLPVLEAMACQTPVVAGNIGSLSEIAQNCALLVNPKDYSAIAENTVLLLKDKNKKIDLIEKGVSRAKKFTWEKTANQTANIYLKILGRKDYQK